MKISNQEVMRRVQLMNPRLLALIRKKKLNYFGHHQAQHTPTYIIRRANRRQAKQGQTKNYVDGGHNRVVRIWLCGGNTESKRPECNRAEKDAVRWCHLTHQVFAGASVHSREHKTSLVRCT